MIISCMHLFTLNSGIGFLEAFTMLLMGITVIPILSATYTFACELTFPVPEGQTVGMIITFGNLLGTGVGILASYLLEFDTRYPMIFFIALCLLALIISFFIEEDFQRNNGSSFDFQFSCDFEQFGAVKQQFAFACWSVVVVASRLVFGHVHASNPKLAVVHKTIGFVDAGLAFANGFDFSSGQYHPCHINIIQVIFEACFFIADMNGLLRHATKISNAMVSSRILP